MGASDLHSIHSNLSCYQLLLLFITPRRRWLASPAENYSTASRNETTFQNARPGISYGRLSMRLFICMGWGLFIGI